MKRFFRKNPILFLLFITASLLMSCTLSDKPDGPGFEVNVTANSVVFAQIGDFGDAGEAEKRVSDLVKSWNPDFIISAGDGNYSNGKYSTLSENIIQYYGDYIFNYDALPAYRCNGKAFEEGTYYLTNGLGGRALAACNVIPLPGDLFTAFCYGDDYGAVKATANYEKLILEFYAVGSPSEPIDRIVITK